MRPHKTPIPIKDVNVIPIENRVFVKVIQPEEYTTGGIFIPGGVIEDKAMLRGEVVSVGRGYINNKGNLQPPGCKPGDKVVFGKHAGTEIIKDGIPHRIFREPDVQVIYESAEE